VSEKVAASAIFDRGLFAAGAVMFVDAIGYGIVLPLLPFFALHLRASEGTVTVLVAVFAFAGLLSAPVIGKLSDHFGRKTVIEYTFLGTLASYIGLLFSTSLASLFLLRALGGAMTGRDAVVQALVTDAVPAEDHVKRIGFLSACRAMGLIIGPLIGSAFQLVFDHPKQLYGATFVAAIALTVVTLSLVHLFLADPPRRADVEPVGPTPGAFAVARPFVIPLAVGLCSNIGFGVLLSCTAIFVHSAFDWSAAETGGLLALSAVSIGAARFFIASAVARRIGPHQTLFVGLVGSGFGMLAMATGETSLFLIGFVTFSLGFGLAIVVSTGLISMFSSRSNRGLLLGVNHGAATVALIFSAIIGGLLFELVNRSAPFLAAAFVLLTTAVSLKIATTK
jgi:DHA1 family tetracycline resistance protein-like MFS transporter